MEDLKILLFEDPAPLYWACGLAEAICLVVAWRVRSRRAWIASAVPVILAALLLLLSRAVTTDRERLRMAMEQLRQSVLAGDVEAAEPLLDDAYNDGVHDKRQALGAIRTVRRAHGLRDARITGVEIGMRPDGAIVVVSAVLTLPENALGRNVFPTRWQLWWALDGKHWRLVSARLDEPSGLGGSPRGP